MTMTGGSGQQAGGFPGPPVDASGLIDPAAFPCRGDDLRPGEVQESADALRSMGQRVRDRMSDVSMLWKGLPASYEAPEQERAYALMDPASAAAEELADRFRKAAGQVGWFADAIAQIRPRIFDVEDRAAAFRAEALQGYDVPAHETIGLDPALSKGKLPWELVRIPWMQHGPAVTRNQELLGEYQGYLGQISLAASEAANAIKRLVTHTPGIQPAQVIGPEQIGAMWGAPASEDRNCIESVGQGAGTFWHNTVAGLGALVGWDVNTQRWSAEFAGQAWLGVAELATIAYLLSPPTLIVTLAFAGSAMLPGAPHASWVQDRANTYTTLAAR